MKMSNHIQIVSIEGNIGSGKSTLLTKIKKHFEKNAYVLFLNEPIDEWNKIKDESGVTILEKFYNDQDKYAFSFQIMTYITRLKLLKHTINKINNSMKSGQTEKYVIITERSLFTDKMVFAKMLYNSGKIEDINYQIYLSWFDAFANEFPVNNVIYVKTDPEICRQRISIRNRNGEQHIPIDYLEKCDQYHNNMLDKDSIECVCKDQLVLDGNNDIYKNNQILQDWIQSIENILSV
jgi:deoxyadenosine/deoxycytidine kinase